MGARDFKVDAEDAEAGEMGKEASLSAPRQLQGPAMRVSLDGVEGRGRERACGRWLWEQAERGTNEVRAALPSPPEQLPGTAPRTATSRHSHDGTLNSTPNPNTLKLYHLQVAACTSF